MIDQLVVLVNLVALFLIDVLFLADINITQDIPPTMEPGSEVRVTVTVSKGDLSGFAKLQLDLPEGLSATAIETKGASFTFADQKAKFIWMALPTQPKFTISYTLSASSNASGLLPIEGRLSYIENNERRTYELQRTTVDLGAPAVANNAQEEEEEDPKLMDLVSAAGGAPATGRTRIMVIDDVSGKPPVQGPGGVSGTRTITPVSTNEMRVEVSVKKGDLRGFGKLQENVPDGFTAIEESSEEAIFTAHDRIVKFVWLNLPLKNELKVVYRLRADERTEGEFEVDGEFGYLLNDETQRVPIAGSKFVIGPRDLPELAEDPQDLEPNETEDPKLVIETPKTEPKPEPKPAPKPKPVQPKEKEQPLAKRTIPSPERGISYKVQITAAHREVGRPYFIARHRYHGDFSIERHQGWIKYVTGNFPAYKEARDQREAYVRAGHDFPGPFVTAYNNGERITVQEALLLSNQQWVQ